MENTKYGRRREGRWTPIRAKAQDTKANPNSWETHLVRKRWDIGLLRALSLWIMMMISCYSSKLSDLFDIHAPCTHHQIHLTSCNGSTPLRPFHLDRSVARLNFKRRHLHGEDT